MSHYLAILVSAVLVNNFVLVNFLGLCPFMGTYQRLDTAVGMGLATAFVLTLAAMACWTIEHLLLEPLGLGYLRTLAFILLIAALVQLVEMAMRRIAPLRHQVLGIFLPLITSNCAVLGSPCSISARAIPSWRAPSTGWRGRRLRLGAGPVLGAP